MPPKGRPRKQPAEVTPEPKATPGVDATPEGSKRRKVGGSDGAAPETSAAAAFLSKLTVAANKKPDAPAAPNCDTGPMSLWRSAPGSSATALASAAFDPAQRAADYPVGKPVGFALLSGALKEIEALKNSGKGSRKTSTVILSNLFRVLIHSRPEDLAPTIYIVSNKVAPDYEDAELGVGDSTVIRTLCDTFGRSEKQIKSMLASAEATDLGEVALQSSQSQKRLMMPAKLTIEKVFGDMKAVAHASGKDSQKVKKDKIQKLLVACREEEAKFIVRTFQSKLRIGIQLPTVMQALAYAFVLTSPARSGAPLVADTRKGANKMSEQKLDETMAAMEAAVRQAFCEMPNIDKLVCALLEGRNAETLAEACSLSLGIPVKPMLAKPSKGIGEVAERLSGVRFTGEWKYDGERAQIHVLSRDKIFVYSRNSENMTEKYPDVIKVVRETLCEGVESCIIDSELVAFDLETKRILPFQVLSTRGRKNIQVENIKVQVCIFAFDLMVHNGTPLVKRPLEERRNALWKTLTETEGKVKFATYRNFDELREEDVQEFLDQSIAGSCEGLMLKTLTDNATYEPSKRSLNWLKLKKDYMDGMGDSIDVVPIGAFYGKGKRTGAYGAYLLAIWNLEEEEFQTVCKAGTGFSDEDLATHYEFFKGRVLQQPESNYRVSDKVKPDVWLEACQVWEIKAADLSISPVHTSAFGVKADGKGIGLRFPRFLRKREDKGPEDSTGADQIVEMYEAQASVGKDGGGGGDDDF